MSKRSYLPSKDLVGRSGYVGTPATEAAKWLRDMATDYLKQRCLAASVDQAVRNWIEVTAMPSQESK